MELSTVRLPLLVFGLGPPIVCFDPHEFCEHGGGFGCGYGCGFGGGFGGVFGRIVAEA